MYYDSSIWKVCQMTEDATLGTVLELATADSADGAEDYQAVLLQRGTADTYPDFIDDSEKDLKQAYGIISPHRQHHGEGPRSLPCAAISRPIMPCWPPSPTTAAMWSMFRP